MKPENRKLLFRLIVYLRPHMTLMVLVVVLGATFSVARYARVYLIKPLVDQVLVPVEAESGRQADSFSSRSAADFTVRADAANSSTGRRELLFLLALYATAVISIVPVLFFARGYCLEIVLARVSANMRQQVAAKLLTLPLSTHKKYKTGDILSRVMHDVAVSEEGLSFIISSFLLSSLMIVIGLIAMLTISWQLTLASVLTVPLAAGVLKLFSSTIRTRALERQEQVAVVTRRVIGMLSGIKVIRSYNGEPRERASFDRQTQELLRRIVAVAKPRLLSQGMVEFASTGVAAAILFVAAYGVLLGRSDLTIGTLAVFAALLATTIKPIRDLSQGWLRVVDSLASAQRVFEVLDLADAAPDPPEAIVLESIDRGIRLDHVTFSYGREPVLRDVSFEIEAGEVVAIVGPTGAGKSTLIDLLIGFEKPDSGEISFDDIPANRLSRRSLLNLVALVTQQPFLFDDTISENIRYGRPEASRGEVEDAGRVAELGEFVKRLPLGYDTPVGEHGIELSGGQRQRITLARAILKRASLLLLDEATSALDARTERTIQAAIENMQGRRTVVIVAHRLSTIRNASRIVVLDRGRVVQEGTHDDLISTDGLYRELVRLQADENDFS